MSKRAKTYLDANASAPLRAGLAEALLPLLRAGVLGNPSSIHSEGRASKRLLFEARARVAASLGLSLASTQSVLTFSSSGSEANQSVVRAVLEFSFTACARPHWILSSVEHDSVLQLVPWFRARGGDVSFLPVMASGSFCLDELPALIRPGTVLVSCLWVNNETGVIQDPAEIRKRLSDGPLLHVDAAQAWGKVPINAAESGADFLTFSGHKIGALAGTGAIWARDSKRLKPLIFGKQESEFRGGTENLVPWASMGFAADGIGPQATSDIGALRDRVEDAILREIPGARVNGREAPRVGNTTNLTFDGISGADALVMALDLEGFCVSAGAACSGGTLQPSHVLMAMGRTRDEALRSIRVSLPEGTAAAEIDEFIATLARTVTRLREKRGRT